MFFALVETKLLKENKPETNSQNFLSLHILSYYLYISLWIVILTIFNFYSFQKQFHHHL